MKIILVYQSGWIIPNSIIYCDDIKEVEDGTEIYTDNKLTYKIIEYSYYRCIDIKYTEERSIVKIIKGFVDRMNKEYPPR